jgi:tetratricopeptide (TPR) repeat protein
LRRNADYQEAVDVCRTGLAIHPGYLSARVTLGRALLELDQLAEAQVELQLVLKSAPENLAALRALAETHHRQGSDTDALTSYRSALALAKNDPDLQQTVDELSRKVEPQQPPAAAPAPALTTEFSYAEATQDLPLHTPPAPVAEFSYGQATQDLPLHTPPAPVDVSEPDAVPPVDAPPVADLWAALAAPAQIADTPTEDIAAREKAVRTIAALEQWLEAIHVARAQRCA